MHWKLSSNMNVVIYQSFIIHTFVLVYDVHTFSVSTVGLLGSNGTEIECLYTQENVSQVFIVTFMAFNGNSNQFEQIATYVPGKTPQLPITGQYLKGRVTLTPITELSRKAIMIFNELMCIDDRFYQCKVTYLDSSGSQNEILNNISISVEVPPLIPDSVAVMHTPAYSLLTSTKHMVHSTSLQSTAVTLTSTKTETLSTLKKQNDTTAFTNSTLPTTDGNSSYSSPSNDDVSSDTTYEANTYSSQQTTAQDLITESDNITVVCTGDVGKPPAKHIFQKYRSGHILSMTYTATKTSILAIAENCSNYRTSNLTFQVTAEDNNSLIRCVVNSSMADPDMYIETAPIEVYYKVSMPTIQLYPNKTDYVVGFDSSIDLICKSSGNPKPNYHWYKANNNESVSESENFTITELNKTKSGMYNCFVSNTFNGDRYTNAANVRINVISKADISTTQSSSTGSSPGSSDKKENIPDSFPTGLVIGGVAGAAVFVIVIIIVIVCIRKKRTSEQTTSEKELKGLVNSTPKPIAESRKGDYDDIAFEEDTNKRPTVNNGHELEDIREHNKEYLKKQKEEEQKKNESNTSRQPAVYAQVYEATKSKNKQNTETLEFVDQQEDGTYAETQEGIYDKSGDRRHKLNENDEHYDTSTNLSTQNSNGDTKSFKQNSQVGSYNNHAFEKDDNRKVATVSPTIRSSGGLQDDEQTNQNRQSQSKKEYENVMGKDQTDTSEGDSDHRTAL